MLTSDPIYNKPYKAAIYINNTGNSTNYYTYDPWTDSGSTNKPIHLSLNLSDNSQGKFVCQIEDGGRTLNRNNINKGARFIVKVGKQASQMTQVLSGLVRQNGDSRGGDRKILYNLYGSSTGIRTNERIIYYIQEAARVVSDGNIDINDPDMKADLLLINAFATANSIQPNYGGEDNLGIVNISNTVANSTVENFIASINIEFGEIQDGISVVEEQSNAEFIISALDIANFRYELTRNAGGRGFTIKNKTYRITGIDDDADDTMYLIKKNWNYIESCYKSDSYSNRLAGILPAQSPPRNVADLGYFPAGGYGGQGYNYVDTTREVAVKFRPSHPVFYPGDIYHSIKTAHNPPDAQEFPVYCRICKNSGTLPMNTGGVVANIVIPPGAVALGNTGFSSQIMQSLSNEEIFYDTTGSNQIDSFTLDTNQPYWFIMSNQGGLTGSGLMALTTVGIPDPPFGSGGLYHTSALRTSGSNSSPSAGGTGWVLDDPSPPVAVPVIGLPILRSQAIIAHDPKAIKNLGSGLSTGGTPIESNLPSFPSIIKTREAGYSYLANQLYYMAKPRANYSIPAVTAPNIPPMPGDILVIHDTILDFSTPNNKIVYAKCGDLSLSWGSFNGAGLSYEAPTKLNINPVGNVCRYV